MASSRATHDRRSSAREDASDDHDADSRTLERLVPAFARSLRVASFWTAIVLPFLYVPLLVTGLSEANETIAFLGLLGLNLLALYVGHPYRR